MRVLRDGLLGRQGRARGVQAACGLPGASVASEWGAAQGGRRQVRTRLGFGGAAGGRATTAGQSAGWARILNRAAREGGAGRAAARKLRCVGSARTRSAAQGRHSQRSWCSCSFILEMPVFCCSISPAPDCIVAPPEPGYARANAPAERVVIARSRVCECDAGCDSVHLGAQLPSRGQARGPRVSRPHRASMGRATHQTLRGMALRRPPRASARPRTIAPGERCPIEFPFLEILSRYVHM